MQVTLWLQEGFRIKLSFKKKWSWYYVYLEAVEDVLTGRRNPEETGRRSCGKRAGRYTAGEDS